AQTFYFAKMVCINQLKRQRGHRRGSWFYHVNDGFHYHKNCRKKGVVYFKCVHYETGCRGRALCDRRRGFIHTALHDVCKRDRYFPLVRQLRSRILMRCRRLELKTFRQILTEESARFPIRVQARVRMSNMRSAMQRARLSVLPPPPQTLRGLSDILQNPRYRITTQTPDGRDNIYARSVTAADGSHHIIFLSQRMARVMKRMVILFGDGTFKSLPAMEGLNNDASQVFALVANWDHTIIPLGWVLMERRTEAAYTAVLREIRNLVGNFPNLNRFISDFELAIRNSVAEVFPGVSLQGCFFHLFRAYIRYAKVDLGMFQYLRRHPYERLIKLCCALPLLPLNHIQRGFFLILRQARQAGHRVYNVMRPFFSYVWRNWVGNRLWCEWMCVFGSFHRTNNTCESHNRVLNNYVGVRHPNIYHFIVALLALEASAYADAVALFMGNPPNRGRRLRSIALDR
ncbi:Anthranilate--CoA ligase, partial [Frankliniella fusca]